MTTYPLESGGHDQPYDDEELSDILACWLGDPHLAADGLVGTESE